MTKIKKMVVDLRRNRTSFNTSRHSNRESRGVKNTWDFTSTADWTVNAEAVYTESKLYFLRKVL